MTGFILFTRGVGREQDNSLILNVVWNRLSYLGNNMISLFSKEVECGLIEYPVAVGKTGFYCRKGHGENECIGAVGLSGASMGEELDKCRREVICRCSVQACPRKKAYGCK